MRDAQESIFVNINEVLHEGNSISGHCGDMSLLCLITVFYIQFLIHYVAIPSTDMYMYNSMSKVLDELSLTLKQGLCAASAKLCTQ